MGIKENLKLLPNNSVTSQVKEFARIRKWNSKTEAITHDGLKVVRTSHIYCEGYGLVECAPYELHFIFEDKSKKIGRWSYLCTCGSPAGIVSWNELGHLMDIRGKTGYVLVCIAHTTAKQNIGIGKHSDMSTE